MTLHLNKSATRLLLPFMRLVATSAFSKPSQCVREAVRLLELSKPPKPSSKKRASKKAKKDRASGDREAHRLETAKVRSACVMRAAGWCEADCGRGWSTAQIAEMDHFYGRANEPQSAINCWMLCKTCHRAKTENDPSRGYWDEKFKAHCARHTLPFRPRLVKSAALSENAR